MHLKIHTLEGTKFEGEVDSVTLPASDGEITILPGHIPLITTLSIGNIKTAKESFPITGGVAEVDDKGVVVLAS